jgi:hypothetical protein
MGSLIAFATPGAPSFYLLLTPAFIANFEPRERVAAVVDDKLFQRLMSARVRLRQIQEQFDVSRDEGRPGGRQGPLKGIPGTDRRAEQRLSADGNRLPDADVGGSKAI